MLLFSELNPLEQINKINRHPTVFSASSTVSVNVHSSALVATPENIKTGP